ncbi:hypothetical protein Ancab_024428 [Ancistrocladus abbreviatus]
MGSNTFPAPSEELVEAEIPYFTSEHLSNFKKNAEGAHQLLLEMRRNREKMNGRRWMVGSSATFRKNGELLHPHFDFCSVLGYVNGLLLIRHWYKIILCYPSTRKFIHIHSSPNLGQDVSILRLGFAHESNDFKLLQIPSFPSNLIEMFSLKACYWKRVSNGDSSAPSARIQHRDPQVFRDGPIYWLGFDWNVGPKSKNFQLLSFDVGTEVLSFISLPK